MKKIVDFFKKNMAIVRYVFFGTFTTAISILSFSLFYAVFHINELISNFLAWVLVVLYAYFSNKAWVFRSKSTGWAACREFLKFVAGRLVTLGIEEVLLLVLVTLFNLPGVPVKIISQVVVMISNYIISTVFVFKIYKKQGEC